MFPDMHQMVSPDLTLGTFLMFVACILFLSWFAFRLGYEAGREYELIRESKRLDAEAERIAAESKRLEDERIARTTRLGKQA